MLESVVAIDAFAHLYSLFIVVVLLINLSFEHKLPPPLLPPLLPPPLLPPLLLPPPPPQRQRKQWREGGRSRPKNIYFSSYINIKTCRKT